jgi:translation elongation factor EF-Tu-like GTPase
MKGYVDSIAYGDLNFANIVSTANIGMKGYVDQGNTIQASAITSANIGMKGYVDSIVYDDSDVVEYLTSGGIGNLILDSNLTAQSITVINESTFENNLRVFGNLQVTRNIVAQGIIATQGAFSGNVSIFGNILGGRVNGFSIGYRDIPQTNFGASDGLISNEERGRHVLTTSSTVSNIYIPDTTVVNWPVGSTVMVINHGTGNANIIANAGVSLYMAGSSNTDANARIVLSRGVATLTNISANVWYIYGTSIV